MTEQSFQLYGVSKILHKLFFKCSKRYTKFINLLLKAGVFCICKLLFLCCNYNHTESSFNLRLYDEQWLKPCIDSYSGFCLSACSRGSQKITLYNLQVFSSKFGSFAVLHSEWMSWIQPLLELKIRSSFSSVNRSFYIVTPCIKHTSKVNKND